MWGKDRWKTDGIGRLLTLTSSLRTSITGSQCSVTSCQLTLGLSALTSMLINYIFNFLMDFSLEELSTVLQDVSNTVKGQAYGIYIPLTHVKAENVAQRG